MAIVLPIGGGNVVVTATLGTDGFGLVGPFSGNDVLVALSVFGFTVGSSVFFVAGSLGLSGEATQDSLNAGAPLIRRSTSLIGRTPAFEIRTTVAETFRFDITAGLIVGTGGSSLVVGVRVASGSGVLVNIAAAVHHVFEEVTIEQPGGLQSPLRPFRLG